MFTYAIVLISCSLFLLGAYVCTHDQHRQIPYFCVFVLTLFSALRGYVGTDTYSYHLMFLDNSTENISNIASSVEPFFALWIKIFSLITDSSFIFIASISVIQGALLTKLVATSKKPAIFLLVYIALFYINFQFNILRAGTAILLLVLANRISDENANQKKFYFFGVTAVLIHYSAAIGLLPMLFIMQKNRNARFLAAILISVVLVFAYYFLIGNEALYGKYVVYSVELSSDISDATNKSFVFSLPIYILLYASVVEKRNFLKVTLLFLVWFILRWATTFFVLVSRAEVVVNALLLFFVIEHVSTGWRNKIRNIALVGLVVMWLYGTLMVLQDDDSTVSGSIALDENHLMSPFNPYKFFWEEK